MRRLLALVVTAAALALPPSAAAAEPESALVRITRTGGGTFHSCAVTTGHQVRCWGDGNHGKLGIGDDTGATHVDAVTVQGGVGTGPLSNVVDVGAGAEFTCALLASHQVRCWGDDDTGQVGDGSDFGEDETRPRVVLTVPSGPLTGVRQLSVGDDHACAALFNGQVQCWGDNDTGELGLGATGGYTTAASPVKSVSGNGLLTRVVQVSAGDDHTCARLQSGQVRCWGWGPGTGAGISFNVDLPVVTRAPTGTRALTEVAQVSAGGQLTCARLENGQARCWGANVRGQLGTGSTGNLRLQPVVVKNLSGNGPLTGVRSIDAGGEFACAVVSTGGGQARCWGETLSGQTGNGNTSTYQVLPGVVRAVSGSGALTGVTQLSAGSFHACARLSSGQARCWGFNGFGGVGDGTSGTDRPRPRVVQA